MANPIDKVKISKVFESVKGQGRKVLTEPEAKEVLRAAGIPVTKESVAKTADEAVAAAVSVGYPVVLKIVSPDILHKSDSGAIKIGLKSEAELRSAYKEVVNNALAYKKDATIHGVVVQEMAPKGIETIVGITSDAQFGPVIMFGLGGVFVEVMGDVTFRVVPVDKQDALEMIAEIKASKILDGYRGLPKADKNSIANAIISLSNLAHQFQDAIKEIDINPLLAMANGSMALDALIALK